MFCNTEEKEFPTKNKKKKRKLSDKKPSGTSFLGEYKGIDRKVRYDIMDMKEVRRFCLP